MTVAPDIPCWIVVDHFTVWGEPVAKERPRFGRGHAYTPKRTRDAEVAIANLFRAHNPDWEPDAASTFGVLVNFWCSGRKDLDNMLKLVLDALNGVVWRDDSQVVHLVAKAHRGTSEPPCTMLAIDRMPPPPGDTQRNCRRCGSPFVLVKPSSKALYCSASCRRG